MGEEGRKRRRRRRTLPTVLDTTVGVRASLHSGETLQSEGQRSVGERNEKEERQKRTFSIVQL
jgi:hypothetical protein